MASDRREERLSDVSTLIVRGVAPAYIEEGGVTVINQRCIRDDRIDLSNARLTDPTKRRIPDDKYIRPFDVLVNSTGVGTAGRVAQVGDTIAEATVDSHVTIVRADPSRIDPAFLGVALRGAQREIEFLAEGSTGQTEISRTRLGELLVSIPPLLEQRAIAYVLSTLDDKITLNRRMNETVEELARAIFKSWFVDFDPVKAKAEGLRPVGMHAEAAALFPDSFEDSELGPIPAGWGVTRFTEIATHHREQIKPFDFPERVFNHYSIPAYDDGMNAVLEEGALIKSGKTTVPHRSTLISRLNPRFPRIWRVTTAGENAVCSTEYYVALASLPYTPTYLYCMASSVNFRAEMSSYAMGTSGSHQRVRHQDLSKLPVVAPGGDVIRQFDLLVEPLLALVDENQSESRSLAEIRDTLLPRLVSGQLRVPDAEDLLAEAPV